MKCQGQLEMWCSGVSALLDFAEQESCLLNRRIDEGANSDVEKNSSKLFPLLKNMLGGENEGWRGDVLELGSQEGHRIEHLMCRNSTGRCSNLWDRKAD